MGGTRTVDGTGDLGDDRPRVAVFGDVGGHRDEWLDQLVALGCDPATLELPEHLSVVQVGDLVHRGPDSHGCLDLAEGLWEANEGRVRLLVGNHEGMYLDGPGFQRPGGGLELLEPSDRERLVAWWTQGRLVAAAAVDTGDGAGVLCTHAGLTRGCWEALDRPVDAAATARALQLLWVWAPSEFWRAGRMLGEPVDISAGPVWAEAGSELYGSWRGWDTPFDQVHGHSSAYRWGSDTWHPAWVRDVAVADHRRRHLRVRLGGHHLWGIDPGLGSWGHRRWEPLVLEGTLAV